MSLASKFSVLYFFWFEGISVGFIFDLSYWVNSVAKVSRLYLMLVQDQIGWKKWYFFVHENSPQNLGYLPVAHFLQELLKGRLGLFRYNFIFIGLVTDWVQVQPCPPGFFHGFELYFYHLKCYCHSFLLFFGLE